jgi:hypothetical protein
MAKRDGNEFTRDTKQHLARSVNYLCSKCGCPTSGPKSGASTSMTIGKAAHISAAAPGGPRFDPSLTPEQRRHYDNGIWMCSNHASLIDEDWRSYSSEQLREMKQEAEERAADALRRSGALEGRRSPSVEMQWRPPATGETRPGYLGLHHVAFVLSQHGKQRARAVIEVEGSTGSDAVRAWISNGAEVRHEHRGLRRGEPCVVPVFTEILEATEFWLDRQLDPTKSVSAVQPGTYITDEAFLTGLHRAPMAPGRYRVRVKLLLGDSANVEECHSQWMELAVAGDSDGGRSASVPRARGGRDGVTAALRELRREVIHEILNVPSPSQDQRGALEMEWIPRAQDWDRRVEQTMLDFGCEAADIEFVRDFPLPPLRTSAFTYPMNSQWSITDVRRERLEAVLDSLLGRPTFRR